MLLSVITSGISVTFRRQIRSLSVYLIIVVIAQSLISNSDNHFWHGLGLGLLVPGGGFLNAIVVDSGQSFYALVFAGVCFSLFGFSLFLWFATGNALAPPLTWLVTAILPLLFNKNIPFLAEILVCSSSKTGIVQSSYPSVDVYFIVLCVMISLFSMCLLIVFYSEWQRQARFNSPKTTTFLEKQSDQKHSIPLIDEQSSTTESSYQIQNITRDEQFNSDELSPADLCRIRLLLDRALQPVDQFEGFEWRDQFQTASVRFQINALSYALSMTQYHKLPAFQGYYTQAQHNLAAKMLDHRVWGYWQLENLWGNFKANPDPIAPHTNIMLTGFYALQLSCFQAAADIGAYNQPNCLKFSHPGGMSFKYDLPLLLQVLQDGYEQSDFGLMPCEPNWIYPLCNIMSVAAMSMHDKQFGTHYWYDVKQPFQQKLTKEFLTPNGDFIAFLSSYTGLSFSGIGGVIMQMFPNFFLVQTLPGMAQIHWTKIRQNLLNHDDMRKAFWRVDVGNYGRSRAAGFATGAAAAVEMGDEEIATSLLNLIEQDHPEHVIAGVAHREKMSLWAHCYEVLARSGGAGVFANMGQAVNQKKGRNNTLSAHQKPHIYSAIYPEVLVAKAVENNGRLDAVLYPGLEAGRFTITVAGLKPNQRYLSACVAALQVQNPGSVQNHYITANDDGKAIISLMLDGRTEFHLIPSTS